MKKNIIIAAVCILALVGAFWSLSAMTEKENREMIALLESKPVNEFTDQEKEWLYNWRHGEERPQDDIFPSQEFKDKYDAKFGKE